MWCEKNVFSIKLTFTETRLLILRIKLLNILLFMAKIHTLLCSPDPLAAGSAPDQTRHSSNKLVPRVSLPRAKPAGSLSRELPGGLRWVRVYGERRPAGIPNQ